MKLFRSCGNKLARLLLVCLKLWRSRYVPPVFDASKSWCVYAKRSFSMNLWELLVVFLEDIVVSLTCEKNILSVCTPFLWMSGLTEIFNVVAMFYSVWLASDFSLISLLSEVVWHGSGSDVALSAKRLLLSEVHFSIFLKECPILLQTERSFLKQSKVFLRYITWRPTKSDFHYLGYVSCSLDLKPDSLFCVCVCLQHQEVVKGEGTRKGWNPLLEERWTWLQDPSGSHWRWSLCNFV